MKLFSKTIFTILLAFLILTLNAQIYPTKTSTRGAESTGSIVHKPLNYVDEKEAALISEQFIATNTKGVGMAPRVYGNIIVFFTDERMAQEDFNDDGKMDDLIVRCYNVSGQELINTETVGHYPAIYENLITFTGWTVRYYNLSDRKTVDTGVLASVDIPSIFGSIIAFPTYETNAGRDLNGDGDLQDSVIMYFDLSKKKLVNTGIVGWGVSIYKDIIAFSTFEHQIAQDLNGDGDTSDSVVRYYNITSATLVNTKAEGWWPSLNNNIIAFESHYITYTAISYYNISAGTLVDTKVDGRMASVYGDIIAFQTPESDYGVGDLNGDGDSNDWVIRYYNTSAGALVNTRAEGVNPSVHGNLIAFETSEQDDRVDLNNDGDTTDSIIRYLSLTTIHTLYVVPSTNDVSVGNTFVINVSLADYVWLQYFEFYLGYNTTILDGLNVWVHSPYVTPVEPQINDTEGYVHVIALHEGPIPSSASSSESFPLASITFKATAVGSSILDLYDTLLFGFLGTYIEHVTIDGSVTVSSDAIPEFPTWTSMLLILIVFTVAIAVYKRRLLKKPIN